LHDMAGLKQAPFWIANWLTDFFLYAMVAVTVFGIFFVFNKELYIAQNNWLSFLLSLVMFGWAGLPFQYLFYRIFKGSSSGTAVINMMVFNIVCGYVAAKQISDIQGQILAEQDEATKLSLEEDFVKMCNGFLCFLPHFGFVMGVMMTGDSHVRYLLGNQVGTYPYKDPIAWDVAGKPIAAMVAQGIVYIGILILLEKYFDVRHFKKSSKNTKGIRDTDNPVYVPGQNYMLQVNRLHKKFNRPRAPFYRTDFDLLCGCVPANSWFGQYVIWPFFSVGLWLWKFLCHLFKPDKIDAVKDLTFLVHEGECFGLLGVNSAGKSTSFKMVTGEYVPDKGDVKIQGTSVFHDPNTARQSVGYCPQKDALNMELTTYENLVLYSRFKGVKNKDLDKVVIPAMKRFGLAGEWRDKQAGQLSGGGKRRLNAAIAVAGSPQLILLDEPTAGLDPSARAQFWKKVKELSEHGAGQVLTSHSVHEAESVCSRLAIMVAGEFVCKGTPTEIIGKFGQGYIITVRMESGNEEAIDDLEDELDDKFADGRMIERQANIIKYRVGEEVPAMLSTIISTLNELKRDGMCRDFSISQTTLDDIFIHFARLANEKHKQESQTSLLDDIDIDHLEDYDLDEIELDSEPEFDEVACSAVLDRNFRKSMMMDNTAELNNLRDTLKTMEKKEEKKALVRESKMMGK